MVQTLNETSFSDAFNKTRPDNFSYAGLSILWEYFETYENDTGAQIELDVIGICCEYSESSLADLIDSYSLESDTSANEAFVWLSSETMVCGRHVKEGVTFYIYEQF